MSNVAHIRCPRSALVGLLAVLAFGAAGAQTPQPGLWENKSRAIGPPELEIAKAQALKMLAGLPPEQRRQMEAVLAKQGISLVGVGSDGTTTTRSCLSKEMAERRTPPAMQPGCTAKAGAVDGNRQTFAFACPGQGSGDGVVTYRSPTEVHTAMTLVSDDPRARGFSMKVDTTSRFVDSDCGSVKPVAMPK